jgi:hypothetical protein
MIVFAAIGGMSFTEVLGFLATPLLLALFIFGTAFERDDPRPRRPHQPRFRRRGR